MRITMRVNFWVRHYFLLYCKWICYNLIGALSPMYTCQCHKLENSVTSVLSFTSLFSFLSSVTVFLAHWLSKSHHFPFLFSLFLLGSFHTCTLSTWYCFLLPSLHLFTFLLILDFQSPPLSQNLVHPPPGLLPSLARDYKQPSSSPSLARSHLNDGSKKKWRKISPSAITDFPLVYA